MNWASKTIFTSKAAWLLLLALIVCPSSFAVEPAVASSVEVYWKSTRAIAVPGISSVLILDDEIAHVELGNETIEFAGLSRGTTVALAYIKGEPVSILVHVIERPLKVISPSLLRREAELAHGVFGSDFQTSSPGGGFALVNTIGWSQQVGDSRLDVVSQVEDNSQIGGHTANLRTGGIAYRTPGMLVSVLDFNESLSGASGEDRVNNFSSPTIMQLRGAEVTLYRKKNEYSFFAGSTIPYYFLSLNATRDIAGFTFHRKETDKLNLFGSTAYVNIPTTLNDGTIDRRSSIMQNAGVTYRLRPNLLLGAQGGISNRGGLLRGDVSYVSFRLSAYGSLIFGSPSFPLNQLQSLFSGTSSFKGGLSYRTTSRLTQGFYFEHANVSPGLIYKVAGGSDFFSPTLSYKISRGESLNFTYTFSRNSGGFSGASTTGHRYDIALNSQLPAGISNSAQATVGSLQDALQINSADQFSIRDSISLPIKRQVILLGVEHDHVQPSLIGKLNSELNLLSPALQAEFLANPRAFIDSTNFPPEIKALLAAEQSTGTTFSASTSLSLGSRLRVSPTLSLTRATNGPLSNSWTDSFGYSMSYQLADNLQLRSSLSNVLLRSNQQHTGTRTTVLSAGFQKSFTAVPGALPLLHHGRVIEGRVFRDNNINGTYNVGEAGLEGVEVRLDDGQIAITDAQGRYKFASVSADEHQVSIALTQFRLPIRMTTRSEVAVDLIQQRIAIANFGILDFARVMGNIYNDLRLDSHRLPSAKGMQGIDVLLANEKEAKKIESNGSGDFEFDDVPPGNYKLSIDVSSLPANYVAPVDSIAVHVSPVSTVVQDIPLRALRSISGRVLLRLVAKRTSSSDQSPAARQSGSKVNRTAAAAADLNSAPEEVTLVPVVGAQIMAGPASAITDAEGKFLLRNLPAGDLSVTIRPVKPVPAGVEIPSGAVKLPVEPVQIQDATIVITNADLLQYLTRESPSLPAARGDQSVMIGKAAPRNVEQQLSQPTTEHKASPSLQPESTAKDSHAVTEAPTVSVRPAAAVPLQLHPAMSLLRIPSVSPAPPATVPVPSSALRDAHDANPAQPNCNRVISLAPAEQCVKQAQAEQKSATGTLQ